MKDFLLSAWSITLRTVVLIPLILLEHVVSTVSVAFARAEGFLYKLQVQIKMFAPMPWMTHLDNADTAHQRRLRKKLLAEWRGE